MEMSSGAYPPAGANCYGIPPQCGYPMKPPSAAAPPSSSSDAALSTPQGSRACVAELPSIPAGMGDSKLVADLCKIIERQSQEIAQLRKERLALCAPPLKEEGSGEDPEPEQASRSAEEELEAGPAPEPPRLDDEASETNSSHSQDEGDPPAGGQQFSSGLAALMAAADAPPDDDDDDDDDEVGGKRKIKPRFVASDMVEDTGNRQCIACGTTSTPKWRCGMTLCNACGLRNAKRRYTGGPRPKAPAPAPAPAAAPKPKPVQQQQSYSQPTPTPSMQPQLQYQQQVQRIHPPAQPPAQPPARQPAQPPAPQPQPQPPYMSQYYYYNQQPAYEQMYGMPPHAMTPQAMHSLLAQGGMPPGIVPQLQPPMGVGGGAMGVGGGAMGVGGGAMGVGGGAMGVGGGAMGGGAMGYPPPQLTQSLLSPPVAMAPTAAPMLPPAPMPPALMPPAPSTASAPDPGHFPQGVPPTHQVTLTA